MPKERVAQSEKMHKRIDELIKEETNLIDGSSLLDELAKRAISYIEASANPRLQLVNGKPDLIIYT